jgi:TrmH family RNA methyltransferase
MRPSPSAPLVVPSGFAADGLNSEFNISDILVWTRARPAERAAVIAISSRHNPFVQQCRDLARKRDSGSGDVLLDGLHLLSEALAAAVPVTAAAAPDAFWESPVGAPLADVLTSRGTILYSASAAVLEAASPVKAPTGIVAVARWRPAHLRQALATQPALAVCAVHVQDPGNTGAIIRAAEAAGATGVITTEGSADPFGWKALRGSMGSAFRLPVAAGASVDAVCREARERGVRVISTSPAGGSLFHEVDLAGPSLILVGAEGAGIPGHVQASADVLMRIPMRQPVESLNVAVAAGVILYEAYRQRHADARS